MKIIGLTGSIGSGKSTVAELVAEFGIPVIDTDKIGHQLLEEDTGVRSALLQHFGDNIMDTDGKVDRATLASLVFGNPQALTFLNTLLHPQIRQKLKQWLNNQRGAGVELVLVEVPLLIETGWTDMFDFIWVTTAPREVILSRLAAKGMTPEAISARFKSQLSDIERFKHAHSIIDTNANLENIKTTLAQLLSDIETKKS